MSKICPKHFSNVFQEASRVFRHQLDEKRALIENTLLTGRQHLGSVKESQTIISSDTSESDGINKLRR